MKTLILLALSLICAPSFTYGKDSTVSLSEPEYVGNISYVDSSEGLTLEKQRASTKLRSGMFTVKSSNIVKGATSPVRVSSGEAVRFIVRAASNDVDPVQVINIFQMTSNAKKKYRQLEVSKAGRFSGSGMNIDFIPFTSKKYGKTSYLITLNNLAAGEYAMTLDGSRDMFNLFGVD